MKPSSNKNLKEKLEKDRIEVGSSRRKFLEHERVFRFALDNLRQNDAMIVGMFQQFDDQVNVNGRIVRALFEKRG